MSRMRALIDAATSKALAYRFEVFSKIRAIFFPSDAALRQPPRFANQVFRKVDEIRDFSRVW